MTNTNTTLHTLFVYDLETGSLYHHPERTRVTHGKPLGCKLANGYLQVKSISKLDYVHRIVWEMNFGPIPSDKFIDHIDGDRTNNRLDNLRIADRAENNRNRKRNSNRIEDLPKGVHRNASDNFYGQVMKSGVKYRTSTYSTVGQAEAAIRTLREELHGEFHHHG